MVRGAACSLKKESSAVSKVVNSGIIPAVESLPILSISTSENETHCLLHDCDTVIAINARTNVRGSIFRNDTFLSIVVITMQVHRRRVLRHRLR